MDLENFAFILKDFHPNNSLSNGKVRKCAIPDNCGDEASSSYDGIC